MLSPYIVPMNRDSNRDRIAGAWVTCSKCNNTKHRILPGKEIPYWWCQDEKQSLTDGQEIEVQYIKDEEIYHCR